jgi:hypothetical protein
MGQAFGLGDRRHSRVVLAGLVRCLGHGAGEEREEDLGVTEYVLIETVITSPCGSMTAMTFRTPLSLYCQREYLLVPTPAYRASPRSHGQVARCNVCANHPHEEPKLLKKLDQYVVCK